MDTNFFATIYQEVLRAWPNRWLGFFLALTLGAIAALVVIALPDQYQSQARVFINSEAVLKPLLKDSGTDEDSESRLAALRLFQTTLLSDQSVAKLTSTPGIGFDVSSVAGRDHAASVIRGGVTIAEEQENLFLIQNTDTDPKRAQVVLQGLLSIFVETYIHQARTDLQAAGDFLDKQITEYKEKLLAMESQMSEFRMTNAEVLGEPSFQTRLSAARTGLRDAELQAHMAQQLRDTIRAEAEGKAKPLPGSSSALLATDQTFPALIDRLGALQAQLNQLLLQYTEKHPDVVATRREIAVLTEQFGLSDSIAGTTKSFQNLPGQVPLAPAVNQAAGPALAGAPQAIVTASAQQPQTVANRSGPSSMQMRLVQANFGLMEAQRKVAAAQAALRVIDQYSATAPAAEAGLDKMNRDYALLKENYDQLVRQRESARIGQAAIQPAGVEQYRFIEAPEAPGDPAGPDRRTLLLIAAAACLTLGAGIAYSFGLLRGTFVNASEAERVLGLPVIARLGSGDGVLGRISQSADTLVLLAGVAGMFVAAFVISAGMDLLIPVRTAIYHFIDSNFGDLVARFL